MARMLPREAENGVGMNRSARGGKCKALERSNGLDTALYKTIPLPFFSSSCRLTSLRLMLYFMYLPTQYKMNLIESLVCYPVAIDRPRLWSALHSVVSSANSIIQFSTELGM